ncbi:amino acid adenylation domain-containing protein [Gramella jeungdoensis]|uniref:Amino acid adenylation domain-containing protein n=1 Tax=Gramella jeungdoensis TaxID=708091 RepID=A0ABT0Z0X7_9FLAO|nr:amino acid adenylation domain-containing protein [Gramella jeungdoensis]MCM8569377.1 amino acid adenylation domain-containing protein [Gramella jeungdoensis]
MEKKNLSSTKRELLEKWLQGEKLEFQATSIPRRPNDSQLKISLPQQRHLFLEMLDRNTAINNLSISLELKGELNLDSFELSVNQILARHEVLRTHFFMESGIPSCEILQDLKIKVSNIDLQNIELSKRKTEAQRLAEAEILRPFDLSQAPLIRLKIYTLEEQESLLLIVIHHTIADGWSLGVFLKELMIFYQSNITGNPIDLPDLPIQYYDYARWQITKEQQAELKSSMSYWKEQLGGELPMLELPTDYAHGAKQTFEGGTHRFVLREEITNEIKVLSRKEDATLFMTLLSAFYILLHRFSGQDDILVGTPVANRNHPELQNLIGVFINTLVLRTKINGELSFREILKQVRKMSLEAFAHQDFPYENLLELLKPKRDMNRPPLFQVVFNLQNAPMPNLKIQGLETNFLELDKGVSQYDMTLMVSKIKGQCHVTIEYNTDLFKLSTINKMFRYYRDILNYAIDQTDKPIKELRLISEEEFQNTIQRINQTESVFPYNRCVHQLFEDQVKKTPEAIALKQGELQITYKNLNDRTNSLALELQKLGVGPGIRVGILMKKSPEIIETLLGVMKAGGTYIPIHIDSPPERIKFILDDANANLLITNIKIDDLNEFRGTVLNINDLLKHTEAEISNLQSSVHSNDLVYMTYTSGSTGQPKGVMISHRSLVNFLWSMKANPGIKDNSVVLALTSISFDPSTLELFLPLIVGARVIISGEEMAKDPVLLAKKIKDQNINLLQATPATWQLLLDTGWKGNPELKALCGGDILTRKLADQLLERVNKLFNLYGPTETTVWTTVGQIKKGDCPITIGKPIDNVQIYVLDRYFQPTPVGVIGEIYISGEGLARAYLNSPKLTKEKFITQTFQSEPGKRMYKTGDLARYLPGYEIEFLGRVDDQVKIQGQRMELGEITAILIQHPMVNEGIVLSKTEASGVKRLVAYFVPKPNTNPDNDSLREFFASVLPSYMIPSFFVRMDDLPLSENQKIDRKSLPEPEDLENRSGYVAPRNEDEEIFATIWQNLLEVDRVGIHDNFFDLGGASVQSILMVAKANMYGYQISIENLFEYQTIAELTKFLKTDHIN